MEFKVDRAPQHGRNLPVAYRVWTIVGDTYYEAFVDDRDVVRVGYASAIENAKSSIRAHRQGSK